MTADGTAPLAYQWFKDGVALVDSGRVSGATTAMLTLTNLVPGDAGSYWVVVDNRYGSVTSAVAALWVNAATLDPPVDLQADGEVYAIAVQPDRRVIVGGAFYRLVGLSGPCLARLNPDWSLDRSFNPGANASVYCLAVQSDGKILVGGDFGRLAGQACPGLGRLNPDGSLDPTFRPSPDGPVHCVALQPDGNVLVGGDFRVLAGQACRGLGRLRPDGTLDASFNSGPNAGVDCVALQPDGKILVAGGFSALGGRPCQRLGRLNPDGTLDTDFNLGLNGSVNSLAVASDGGILLGGTFTTIAGRSQAHLARLSPEGILDAGFTPRILRQVAGLALQTDGQVVVGGGDWVSGYLGRINPDGSPDTSFLPEPDYRVYALTLQPDGRVVVGGAFGTLAGQPCRGLGRLSATSLARQNLDLEGSTIIWSRSGAGPELTWTIFEYSSDGRTWVPLGQGSRTAGGWQLQTVSLPPPGWLRAWGYVAGGRFNGSSWLVECWGGKPWLVIEPLSRTNQAGTVATLAVEVVGTQPMHLQWYKDGTALTDGPKVSGAITPTLTLSHVLGEDAGNYWLVVSNRFGSSTSAVARLTVTGDPFIVAPPMDQTRDPGQSVSFNVVAGGTEPLSYQWFKEGVALVDGGKVSGATTPVLTLTNLFPADAGDYWVVVSNLYGSVTSAVARLTVTPDPVIVMQPQGLTRAPGQTASFSVAASGTPPLAYQWFKDGLALVDGGKVSGATTPVLTVTNLFPADAGDYWVVVSNLYSSVTSAVARLTLTGDPVILGHPASQQRQPGESVNFAVVARGTQPLSYQWFKDGVALVDGGNVSGARSTRLTVGPLQWADAGAYWVVVSNLYSSVTSLVAGLTINAVTLDAGFDPGADYYVYSFAVQPDGKIVVGGAFSSLAGESRSRLARLNPDGSLEPTLNPGANGSVYWIALQPEGKMVLGGHFVTLAGLSRPYIGRLNADGTLDEGFNPSAGGGPWWAPGVYAAALQPDGKMVVGGGFRVLGGDTRLYLGRINPDGLVDPTFNPGADWGVYCLALQRDGKILVGGGFTNLAGQRRPYLGRLNPDGSLDPSFDPAPDDLVLAMALQSDGKILVAGDFARLGGLSRARLGRLNPDGSVDASFNPGADNRVYSLVLQSDGKIVVGGDFTTLGSQARSRLGRLHPDGTLDFNFDAGANNVVYGLTLQPDGKILVGGMFTNLLGQPRAYIARLNNPDPATESLTFDGCTITWLRGGSSPALWRASFEASTNQTDWVPLGDGIPIPGGWQLTGLSLPSSATIRARGYTCGGRFSSSRWFVESLLTVTTPLRLSIQREGAQVVLSWTGGQGPYQVQQSTDLSDPAGWTDLGEPLQTNSITLPIGPRNQFLRVKGQ